MEDQVHATSMFWYDFPMFVGFSNHLIVKPYNKITRVSPMLRNPLFKAIINFLDTTCQTSSSQILRPASKKQLQLLIFLLEILHNQNLATDAFENNFSKVHTLLNWLLRITPTKAMLQKNYSKYKTLLAQQIFFMLQKYCLWKSFP